MTQPVGPGPLDAAATATIARGLGSPHGAFSAAAASCAVDLIAAASHHRVLVLLGSRLRAAGTLATWPAEFHQACVAAERQAVTLDCIRQIELVRVLDALSAAGLRVLTFKGAALAHSHYPAPHVRSRTDSDLLVAPGDQPRLSIALDRLGYLRQQETSGRLVSHQSHFGRSDRHGIFHALDVHWKVSNRHTLADRFGFEELWRDRVPLAALGPSAATVSPAHALLLALLHRAGHHPGSLNLLWIYDIHLLASGLTDAEVRQVEDLAAGRGLGPIAGEGLTLAGACFGSRAVESLARAIGGHSGDDAAAELIPGRWGQADIVRHDLAALPTWKARGRLIREHLFPAPSYIRGKYGVRSNLLLPALYAWRVVAGAPRWLRRRDDAG